MATSIISAGDASNLGLQTTGGDDGALVLRSGAAGAKVDALSIAAVGTGAFVGQVTATGFTGTLDGILGSGTAAAATVTTLVTSGIVSVDDTTTSTSGTTGSIHTDGGLGVAGTSTLIGVTTHGDDVVSDTDSTDDLGTTSVRWANLFVDGITATDQITATGFTGTLDGILGSGAAAAATTTTLASTTITASGIIKTDDTTAATSTTDGSLQTDGGLSVAADAVIGDDLFMLSDAAVLTFGADKDVTLTHVADTGILLNSTMVIQFNDASQNIGAPSNAILDINATDEIELNATLIDINGNVDISGTALITGVATHGDDVVSDTDSTDDLGTTGVRWANLFVDAITATDQITATGFTGTLDGILGSGTPAAATVTTIDASGVATATTFEPDGDTAAGDNAAIGYTAAEGLILTGQGSTSDITLKNDADAVVFTVPTGTDDILFPDNAKAMFGAGSDLQIHHDSSNSYIQNSTGNLNFQAKTGESSIVAVPDGAVTLYHNNLVKLATTSGGIGVTGAATFAATNGSTDTTSIDLGSGRSGNGYAFVDLIGDATYTDYGLRLIRNNGGANTTSSLRHRGTGTFTLECAEAGDISFETTNAERMRIKAAGNVGIGTTAPATELHVVGDVTVAGGITGVTSLNSGQIGGRRNIIYNGEMKVAQRSASVAGLGAASGYFTLDRWYMQSSGTAGRYTMAQVADGPPGFANCLKLTTTTADTSIAASEYLMIRQKFEGQDLQQLKKGTASAEQVTVSFYVKGNADALYVCELADADNQRVIAQSFAVTTSWNRIELTFAADTSDPLDDDNAQSMFVSFWLHAGASFTGGTFSSNTWADIVEANRIAVDDFTSIFDATSRTLSITGVQLEIGATATEFESRTFSEELALCQRYFELLGRGPAGEATVFSDMPAKIALQTNYCPGHAYKVVKRAPPTVVLFSRNNTSGKVSLVSNGADEGNNWAMNSSGVNAFHLAIRDGGTHTAGIGLEYGFTADAEL